jgi:hypothetical protein
MSWSKVLVVTLIVAKLIMQSPAFHGTRRFITGEDYTAF